MICGFCGFHDTQVKDSRPSTDGTSIKRRRVCPKCGAKFVTFERVERREMKVVKRNGDIKLFDVNKLVRSIEVATRKRPITNDMIETIISRIVTALNKHSEGEVSSQLIGSLVMDELAQVDQVACIRYASVYMDFGATSDFGDFIHRLGVKHEE
jgi:transcriptional repressor NrdR